MSLPYLNHNLRLILAQKAHLYYCKRFPIIIAPKSKALLYIESEIERFRQIYDPILKNNEIYNMRSYCRCQMGSRCRLTDVCENYDANNNPICGICNESTTPQTLLSYCLNARHLQCHIKMMLTYKNNFLN